MIKRTVSFIHNLRIFLLAFIVVAFLSLIGLNPITLGQLIGARIGEAVGLTTSSASIQPNPYNTLALQLKMKEAGLDDRETSLQQKEKELLNINDRQNKIIIVLASSIFFLFCLVFLNYYFDYKRRKKEV